MDRKAALITIMVALIAIAVAVAATALLSNDDNDGKIKADISYNVKIECDDYTKFLIDGDGPGGGLTGTYKKGTVISLEAVSEVGHFDGYYEGDKCICSDKSYELTVKSDISIRLVSKDVAVVKINGNDCTLYVNGLPYKDSYGGAVNAGTPMTVYAVSGEGSVVTGWTGSFTSEYPICSFSADSDTELTVTTEETSEPTAVVNVLAIFPDNGSIIVYGQNAGNHYCVRLEQSGDPLLLSAEAKEGHSFGHWIVKPGSVYYESSIEVAVSTDMEITAVFLRAD